MKAFVALCLVAVAVAQTSNLNAEQSAKIREYHKECLDSTKVNPEVVNKARKGEFKGEDKNLDSYVDCMFKKAEFIDEAGKLQTETIKKKATGINEADINLIFTECASAQNQPKEKVARAAYECYLSKTKVKLQLLPETA